LLWNRFTDHIDKRQAPQEIAGFLFTGKTHRLLTQEQANIDDLPSRGHSVLRDRLNSLMGNMNNPGVESSNLSSSADLSDAG
jgi:hypothetical protein